MSDQNDRALKFIKLAWPGVDECEKCGSLGRLAEGKCRRCYNICGSEKCFNDSLNGECLDCYNKRLHETPPESVSTSVPVSVPTSVLTSMSVSVPLSVPELDKWGRCPTIFQKCTSTDCNHIQEHKQLGKSCKFRNKCSIRTKCTECLKHQNT